MKKIFLLLTFFIGLSLNAQENSDLKKEILDAIEFGETDSTTVSVFKWKIPNKHFDKEKVSIHSVFIIDLDSTTSEFFMVENKAKNIAFFPKNGQYQFYISKN